MAESMPDVPAADSLRQRATAIQVIGAPLVDRSAVRQRRLGASLLLALFLGRNALGSAMSGPEAFHTAIGRFLMIFGLTVFSIRALGNLYDQYLDAAIERAGADTMASTDDADQRPSAGGEGLGSDR